MYRALALEVPRVQTFISSDKTALGSQMSQIYDIYICALDFTRHAQHPVQFTYILPFGLLALNFDRISRLLRGSMARSCLANCSIPRRSPESGLESLARTSGNSNPVFIIILAEQVKSIPGIAKYSSICEHAGLFFQNHRI